MATLYFAVWSDAKDVALGAPLQESSISIGATTQQGTAITGSNRKNQRVRIFCDVDAFVTWGADPSATNDGTSGRPMGAENPEYFEIEAGHKIACIERT